MGKVFGLTERLLPYLEARGMISTFPGLFGGFNKIVNYRACDRPWWGQGWSGVLVCFPLSCDTILGHVVVLDPFSCRKQKCEE